MRALYLLLLLALVVITLPLELVLHTRVYARPLRWLLSLLPVVPLFCAWDVYAIARHHWTYSRRATSGVLLPGRLPVEELLFFVVVPTCAILTLEAVRQVRGWPVGDEPSPVGDEPSPVGDEPPR